MNKALHRKLKQMLSLITAMVLTVTSMVPAMAYTKADDGSIDITTLQEGDILHPDDVLTDPGYSGGKDYPYASVRYEDYSDLVYNGAIMATDDIKGKLSVRGYTSENPTALLATEFDCWKVREKKVEVIGSYLNYTIYLEAVKKSDVSRSSFVTVSAAVNAPTSDAAVTLMGFDQDTMKPLERKSDGSLKARPGDLVYIITSPVRGLYSNVTVTYNDGMQLNSVDFNDDLKSKNCNYVLLKQFSKADGKYAYNTKFSYYDSYLGNYTLKDYTFLPDETDTVATLVVPYSDVAVTADYNEYSGLFNVTYNDVDSHENFSCQLNEEITLKNPEDPNLLCWSFGGGYTYYHKGEKVRVTGNASYDAFRAEEGGCTFTVPSDAPCKVYYYNDRYPLNNTKSTDCLIDVSTVKKYYSLIFVPDQSKIPEGKFISGYSLINGAVEDFTVWPWYMGAINASVNFKFDRKIDASNLTLHWKFDDIDPDVAPAMTFEPDVIHRNNRKAVQDLYNNGNMYRSLFLYSDYFENTDFYKSYFNNESKLLDLNRDGKWDLLAYFADFNISVRLLDGASSCPSVIDVPYYINDRGDIYKYTYYRFLMGKDVKMHVTYVDGDKEVAQKDVTWNNALGYEGKLRLTKNGYNFLGWSTTPESTDPNAERPLFDFSNTPITKDTTLYAVWEKNGEATDPDDEEKEEVKETGKDEKGITGPGTAVDPGSAPGNKEKGKENQTQPAVGDKVKDPETGAEFTVTSSGEICEVRIDSVVISKKVVTVPDSINVGGVSYKVTSMDTKLFEGKGGIKTIEIGENIAKVSPKAFKKCKKLKKIKIKNKKKVIKLKKSMFAGIKGKVTVLVPRKLYSKYKQMVKKNHLTKKVKLKKY